MLELLVVGGRGDVFCISKLSIEVGEIIITTGMASSADAMPVCSSFWLASPIRSSLMCWAKAFPVLFLRR